MVRRALSAGALVLVVALVTLAVYQHSQNNNLCDACHRTMRDETHYQIAHTDGTLSELCCPRCGLRHQATLTDVAKSEVADYHTGRMFAAKEAFFVEGSDVHACDHHQLVQEDRSGSQYALTWDRCLPSLVAFVSEEQARKFREDHGGQLRHYDELVAELY